MRHQQLERIQAVGAELGSRDITTEIRSHAELLAQMAARSAQLAQTLASPAALTAALRTPDSLGQLAARLHKMRESRRQFIDADLMGEPGWDILLDVYAHQMRGQPISVSAACIGAGVPATTALRWITVLTRRELVERIEDASDRRRVHLRLTVRGEEAVAAALRAIVRDIVITCSLT